MSQYTVKCCIFFVPLPYSDNVQIPEFIPWLHFFYSGCNFIQFFPLLNRSFFSHMFPFTLILDLNFSFLHTHILIVVKYNITPT